MTLTPTDSGVGTPDGLLLLISPFIVASLAIGVIAILRSLVSADSAFSARPKDRKGRRIVGGGRVFETRSKQAIASLQRIGIPTLLAAVSGFLYFDNLSLYISSTLDVESVGVLAQDNDTGQFVQNFLVVIDLLFSILAGSAYSKLYKQQESIYIALYNEVTLAKSLLEQLTLIGQGRIWYPATLRCVQEYLNEDLRQIDVSPVKRLSGRPMDDPLEAIMFMTSVGVPSVVYDTVKDLRQARGERLASFQRKFPVLGIILLYVLALLELFAFPLLGAGTAGISEVPELTTVSILELQSVLFAALCGCVTLVLRIIQELWQSSGGVFNTDDVLEQMLFGLEEELRFRMQGREDLMQIDKLR